MVFVYGCQSTFEQAAQGALFAFIGRKQQVASQRCCLHVLGRLFKMLFGLEQETQMAIDQGQAMIDETLQCVAAISSCFQ